MIARIAVVLAAVLFTVTLVAGMQALAPAAVALPPKVGANMDASGVAHPVTAVLLNFRAYDTLLEVAVLLLALVVVLALGAQRSAEREESGDTVLQTLARLAAPSMALAAVYLLWAGAHRPGGAFQAGAVLAAGAVLLQLCGVVPAWTRAGLRLRLGLVGGFAIFLGIAVAVLHGGALLEYPSGRAGSLILAVEAGLTVSLGLILAGLFLFLTDAGEGRE